MWCALSSGKNHIKHSCLQKDLFRKKIPKVTTSYICKRSLAAWNAKRMFPQNVMLWTVKSTWNVMSINVVSFFGFFCKQKHIVRWETENATKSTIFLWSKMKLMCQQFSLLEISMDFWMILFYLFGWCCLKYNCTVYKIRFGQSNAFSLDFLSPSLIHEFAATNIC